jgi:hypothetical protein
MVKNTFDSKPVFIVGMNGSGTTMLLDCLDSHPLLYGFRRETKVIPYFVETLQDYGDLDDDGNFCRLWEDVRNIPDFHHVNQGLAPPLPEDWRDYPRDLAAVLDGIFLYFAGREGKSRWCEKTPMHALHIALLGEIFPSAKFIHIIRDGRACAASFHRRWGRSPELTIYRWKHVVSEAQKQARDVPGRYLDLTYEDMTREPEPWMRKVCSFLDVPFDERVLTTSRERPVTIGAQNKNIVVVEDRWRSHFSSQQIESLEKIAGSTLDRLGYQTTNPDGDKDPNMLLRRCWLYSDFVKLGLSDLRQAVSKRDGSALRLLKEKIGRSIKQRTTTKY